MNGNLEGGCGGCHALPPATGAHLAHVGVAMAPGSASYTDLGWLETRNPAAMDPTAALVAKYQFGCANCHPIDFARHAKGAVDPGSGKVAAQVVLDDGAGTTVPWAAAQSGNRPSLKSMNATGAAYIPATKTCSGVYCHSSGQAWPDSTDYSAGTPVRWDTGSSPGCGGCHGNPPRYPTTGAGVGGANGHIGTYTDDWGDWVAGHFGGIGGNSHVARHGASGTYDEATISCQTCHFDTTDPSNTGPSGFYYLDTTGDYVFSRANPGDADLVCISCHTGTGYATQKTGKTLPLRHVNGLRDVVFDPRDTLPASIPYLQAPPNRPSKPYWRTPYSTSMTPWPNAVVNGTFGSFAVSAATYNNSTKTCSNVECHGNASLPVVWGQPPGLNCQLCHY
jgi:predicted CxxxxCH...CXXCH cytochrome family protein